MDPTSPSAGRGGLWERQAARWLAARRGRRGGARDTVRVRRGQWDLTALCQKVPDSVHLGYRASSSSDWWGRSLMSPGIHTWKCQQ